jgi:hypothetical protein
LTSTLVVVNLEFKIRPELQARGTGSSWLQ